MYVLRFSDGLEAALNPGEALKLVEYFCYAVPSVSAPLNGLQGAVNLPREESTVIPNPTWHGETGGVMILPIYDIILEKIVSAYPGAHLDLRRQLSAAMACKQHQRVRPTAGTDWNPAFLVHSRLTSCQACL